MIKNLFKSQKYKNKKFENQIYIEAIKKPIFQISNIKKAFNHLR